MASIADVEATLGALVEKAVYPDGTSNPSVSGNNIEIVSGWPVKDRLDSVMASGNAIVSIYPLPGMQRNTSRFPRQWQTVSMNAPTLTLTVLNNAVTVGGVASAAQNCMIVVNGEPYAYSVKINDTAETIASNIAAIIPGASSTGAIVTVSPGSSIEARVGVSGTVGKELKRQQSVYQIITWAPTPTARNTISEAIDVLFAETDFLSLPDGFAARLLYQGAKEQDHLQKSRIFRRDLQYLVEYPTTKTETQYTITHPIINTTVN